MDRHCRQAWQGAGCLFQTAGTLCRTFANPFLAVRPYLVWSSCEPKTFLPARASAHSPYTGDAFPSTSPQSTSCSAAHRPLERRQAVLPPTTPFSSDNSPVSILSRLSKGNRASPITHASSGQQFEVADRDKALVLVLHVPVVEVKFKFVGIFEIVHHHDEVVRLVAFSRIVSRNFSFSSR